MHIKHESICDIGSNFEQLFKSFKDLQYIIVYDIVTFSFLGNDFSLENLSMIMQIAAPSEKKVSGIINHVTFNQVQKEVALCFSHVSENGVLYMADVSSSIVTTRTKIFWELIEKHFTLPPTSCYQHYSGHGGYFDFGIMWEFCFILLNEQHQGIILYVAASD